MLLLPLLSNKPAIAIESNSTGTWIHDYGKEPFADIPSNNLQWYDEGQRYLNNRQELDVKNTPQGREGATLCRASFPRKVVSV